MNTPVSFSLARLLKDKNIHILSAKSMYASNGELTDAVYDFDDWCFAPTIAEAVMWLYKNHKIWISVDPENDINDTWFHTITNGKSITAFGSYSSLTEAYEKGIKHILNEMI